MGVQRMRQRFSQMGRTLQCMRRLEYSGRGESGSRKRFQIKRRIVIASESETSACVGDRDFRRTTHPHAEQRTQPGARRGPRARINGAYRRRTRNRQIHTRAAEHSFHTVAKSAVCLWRGERHADQDACREARTSEQNIFEHIENVDPGLIVIDSIQTIASEELESPAGSVGQVRECSARLLRYAKESGVPVIVIGHITKEGSIAGPKVLEHIVDTVLQFEGDRHYLYRLLRSIKNRFGSTSELGIYEMVRTGLREVTNPSEILLSQTDDHLSGTAIGVTMEGIRPLMIEVQALVSTAAYGTPQRSVTGFDAKRMNMLLAVLEKRVGFKLAQKDVFLNIAGGMKVNDPALDLAVISAILSSNVDMAVPRTVCMAGEVGLTGEIRPVTRVEQRIQEAEKLGMEQIIIPRSNVKGMDLGSLSIKITEVSKVEEAFRMLFS